MYTVSGTKEQYTVSSANEQYTVSGANEQYTVNGANEQCLRQITSPYALILSYIEKLFT